MRYNKIKAFYSLIDDTMVSCLCADCSLQRGAAALLKTVGDGKMKPNILLMGFKDDWRTCDRDYLNQYFETIQ